MKAGISMRKSMTAVVLAAALCISFLQPAAVYAAQTEETGLVFAEEETSLVSAEDETGLVSAEEETESVLTEPKSELAEGTFTVAETEVPAAERKAPAEADMSAAALDAADTDASAAALNAADQTDPLVEFTFLTPATKVILDGQPLMILPDTLTARLKYYDSSGNLVDRDIRYTSDAVRTGASWTALQYFLGTGSNALDPLYDSSSGDWYYMIHGNRYDVPMQEIAMSSSDALDLGYEEDFWGVDDEWPREKVRLYRVTPDEAMIWSDLYMNRQPSDSAFVSRGSRLGGACTFSKEDPADSDSLRTAGGESFYYANYYYGSNDWMFVDCRPTCEPDYIGAPVYTIYASNVSTHGVSLEFATIILEEGWYRVSYLLSSLMKASPQVKLSPTTCDTSIDQGIFETNYDSLKYMTNRSEPIYLPRGKATFRTTINTTSTTGFYESILVQATVEKLEPEDIVTGKLGVYPYGIKGYWDWHSSGGYSYGKEGVYFAADDLLEVYDFPSPDSIIGLLSGNGFSFKYANYMRGSDGKPEEDPFSFVTNIRLSEMELDGSTMLRYSLAPFGEITAQLLDPNGEAMDLTSTEEMPGGTYTMHMVSRNGDVVMEEQNIPIWIPDRNKYEILEADDFSLSYQTGIDIGRDVYDEFEQSAENPDEYTLNISCKWQDTFSIYMYLLERLSVNVNYESTVTEFSKATTDDGITYVNGMEVRTDMQEKTVRGKDVFWVVDEPEVSPVYLADPYTANTDYLEFHLYDRDGVREYTDFRYGDLESGEYLMTVTSGMHQYEKRIYITLQGCVYIQSITLSDTEISLRPGETHQLQYELKPSNADFPDVEWVSEDTGIAGIENGLITARREGDTTITIRAQNYGREVSASCIVHVGAIKVESVKLSETEITLHPGESVQLDYELIPEDNDYPDVWWSVQDENVATVEDGLVEAASLGDTTVTLHAQDGEVTASCTVHVVPNRMGSILLEDFDSNRITNGGTTEMSVGSGGGMTLIYMSDTDPAFQLEEDDIEGCQIKVLNSNPAVVSISQLDNSTLYVESLKQGSSVLTVTVKGNGWEKTAKFNIFVQFADVTQKSKYYYNPVYWAAKKGITNGYGGWEFGVGLNCTREDLVTFLWRMKGKPAVTASDRKKYHFPDVESGKYYEDAVVWAAKNEITKGYSSGPYKGKFGVSLEVTREDTVTFLYRVAGKPTVSAADQKKYTFPDVKSTAYYAKPVAWAAKKGITKGYSSGPYKGKFGVGLNVLREDIVTFMYRYQQ